MSSLFGEPETFHHLNDLIIILANIEREPRIKNLNDAPLIIFHVSAQSIIFNITKQIATVIAIVTIKDIIFFFVYHIFFLVFN